MRRGATVKVVVVHPLAFENLRLNPQSAQGLVSVDESAAFLAAAVPFIQANGTAREIETPNFIAQDTGTKQPRPARGVEKELEDLGALLRTPLEQIRSVTRNATVVSLQLQEVLAALPRPRAPAADVALRDPMLIRLNSPNPRLEYSKWRRLLVCELAGGPSCAPSTFVNLLGSAASLQLSLATFGASGSGFDSAGFAKSVQYARMDINALPTQAERERYQVVLDSLVIQSSGVARYALANADFIKAMLSDLGKFLVNIEAATDPDSGERPDTVGKIFDAVSSSGVCSRRIVGCQVVFSVDAVNGISTHPASVPAGAALKSLATITVLFAEPRWEVSTGVLVSTLPNLGFTTSTATYGNTGDSIPSLGNVTIARAAAHATYMPFEALNFQLGHDQLWSNGRRRAYYATLLVGLDPNTSHAEFAAGFSGSYRLIMLSLLYHLGNVVGLTDGEHADEVLCKQPSATTTATYPLCSGPPAPTTRNFLRGAFAVGLSVRTPNVFGGSAVAGAGH
jgi:hypothetical protein